jgi:uncharacterized protein
MADKASPFKLNEQAPVLQVVVSLFLVVVSGTLLFWLFVYAGSLIFGTDPQNMLVLPDQEAGIREIVILKYLQVSRQVSLFLIPSLVIIFIVKGKGRSYTGMDKFPGAEIIGLIVLLAFFVIPVTVFTGQLNARMDLPGWLSGIEEKMIAKEEMASKLTELLIRSVNITALLVNVLLIAVIPAFCEELLFRGVLQQLMVKVCQSAHLGIWLTAIIFSAIHLQFFGFIPRMILGLSFGYLFYLTRSLWSSILAHFINNAIPVVISYFTGWKALNERTANPDSHGAAIPVISLVVCGLIFYWLRKEFLRNNKMNASAEKI